MAEDFLSHLETVRDDAGNVQDICTSLNKWAFQGIAKCIYIHVSASFHCILGVSYFVYGEKINIFSTIDPMQREFMEAGLAYNRSLIPISRALPLYKLFPTKPFREYRRVVRRVQKAGVAIVYIVSHNDIS